MRGLRSVLPVSTKARLDDRTSRVLAPQNMLLLPHAPATTLVTPLHLRLGAGHGSCEACVQLPGRGRSTELPPR
ncbi:hypothetical protein D4764_05G0007210 [Takifugu flavidus]|uniref:Uncharacterized protein n=1 Tax=Takifugu flavidus TaxID=433684 RepID=A0A5C6N2Q5_9TELE|nr:hypothetical protein D4764_05G0007210 [Takifugu flavidus]